MAPIQMFCRSRDGIAQGLQNAAVLQTWNFQSDHGGHHTPRLMATMICRKNLRPGDILPKTSKKRERFLQDATKRRCSTSQPEAGVQTVPSQLKVNSWGVGSCGSSCVSQAPEDRRCQRGGKDSSDISDISDLISKISCKLRISSSYI